jgi:predicted NAD/FAD-binding protein
MLAWAGHPQWRTVSGGSRSYVQAIERLLQGHVRVDSGVEELRRFDDHVELRCADGSSPSFDHAILACHADDALALLGDPSDLEQEILGTFEYQGNEVVLHTDPREMPVRRKAWAAWNYHVCGDGNAVSLTYWMNALQSLDCPADVFVTVNPREEIATERRLRDLHYRHPLYSIDTSAAQERHRELIDHRRTSYCGAYWGFGFHEDGVRSALAVGEAFGVAL